MKHVLFSLLIIFSINAKAVDMSRTEDRDAVYNEEDNGEAYYRGGCSTHQDYEKIMFIVTETVVDYFEPRGMSEADFKRKMKPLEKELIKAASIEAGKDLGSEIDLRTETDDITVEKIKSTKFISLDLWRLNLGVGGGNGMYIVFNRVVKNNKPTYNVMSYIFDGDVSFCDSAVWISK